MAKTELHHRIIVMGIVTRVDHGHTKAGNARIIEQVCADVAQQLRAQGLSERTETYLEGYAYCIRDKIRDTNLRNAPVML